MWIRFFFENISNRIFPTSYDEWDIESKRGFLIGCYSANGSVIKNKRVSYKTTCRDFADKLVETLLNDFLKLGHILQQTNKKMLSLIMVLIFVKKVTILI